jgi:DNA-binding response OmpR family regulator
MRILVIESDVRIRQLLKKALEIECFTVDTSGDGQDGSYQGRIHDYDLIVIGDHLPRKSSIEVCSEIRGIGKVNPIIITSSETNIDYKVRLLNAGADDYLVKPFDTKELLCRIRTLLRRPHIIINPLLQVDDFILDTARQKAFRGDSPIYLTRKEFALAEYLMRNCGMIVSKGALLEHVWDDELDPFSNTLESHILNLRKKIENSPRKLIHTFPGRGYKME